MEDEEMDKDEDAEVSGLEVRVGRGECGGEEGGSRGCKGVGERRGGEQ